MRPPVSGLQRFELGMMTDNDAVAVMSRSMRVLPSSRRYSITFRTAGEAETRGVDAPSQLRNAWRLYGCRLIVSPPNSVNQAHISCYLRNKLDTCDRGVSGCLDSFTQAAFETRLQLARCKRRTSCGR